MPDAEVATVRVALYGGPHDGAWIPRPMPLSSTICLTDPTGGAVIYSREAGAAVPTYVYVKG